MKEHIRPTLVMLAAFTLLLGFAYPAAVTGVARLAFPGRSAGSVVERDGKVVGSALVGQPFDDPRYFWGRPSATSPAGNASASSGSNLGPTDKAQAENVAARVKVLLDADPTQAGPVPADLVTASASGLDPHISPEAALWQVHRVATLRSLTEAAVRALVARHVEPRTLGILGEPRVNVLLLNLDLETLKP
jgi:K+-transporting ATPase ATPase C chain